MTWQRRDEAAVVAALAILCGGCAADMAVDLDAEVRFENRSHFVVQEIRLHDGDVVDAWSLPGTPLEPGGAIEEVLHERAYVSAVREKVRGGPLIAITTVEPLPIERGRYVLEIFDQAFRLRTLEPWPDGGSGGGGLDGGPADGGAGDGGAGDAGGG